MPIYGTIMAWQWNIPLVAVSQDGLLLVWDEYVELAETTYETIESKNNNCVKWLYLKDYS